MSAGIATPGHSSEAPSARRRRSPTERLELVAGWLLSAVATAMMWLILIGPCVAVLLIAFTDWEFGMPTVAFVGFENFQKMFADRVFWVSLRNTVIYVGLLVPI
jgi:multiple sugar transport system permease protein